MIKFLLWLLLLVFLLAVGDLALVLFPSLWPHHAAVPPGGNCGGGRVRVLESRGDAAGTGVERLAMNGVQ